VKTIVCLVGLVLVATATAIHSQDGGSGGITIRPVENGYHGSCPVMVHFRATIYPTVSRVKVRYHWERSGGKTTPQQSGETTDGKLNVDDEFAVGKPGHAFTATDRLHVLFEGTDGEVVSPKVESTGTCTR
jgi:hypothetical protein